VNVNTRPHSDSIIEFGVIGRPHGVRGELRVYLHHSASDLIYSLEQVWIRRPGEVKESACRVVKARPGGDCVLLFLAEVNDRNAAEALKGASLCIRREQLPPTGEDELYAADLIGLTVYCDGMPIGTVASSCNCGGVEVIDVVDGRRELQVPLVERYLARWDLEHRAIHVRDIDGLPETPIGEKETERV